MKFNLTITDATLDELRAFLGGAGTPAIVKAALAPVTVLSTSTATDDEAPEHVENPEGAPAFDSAGLPWDERIHSANKGTNTNGTWRKRRGVDDATIAAVEAELKGRALGAMTHPAPIPAAIEQYATGGLVSAPVAPMIPALSPTGESIMPVQVVQPQPAPVPMTPEQFQQTAPVAPVIPVQSAPVTMAFGDFMSAIAQKSSAGVIDHAYIVSLTQQTSAAIGKHLNAITDAMNIPEVIPAAIAIMQRDGKW